MDGPGMAALARAAPALQELRIGGSVDLTTPSWSVPHLRVLKDSHDNFFLLQHVVLLLQCAPRLQGLTACIYGSSAEELRDLARIAAAGGEAIAELQIYSLPGRHADMPPVALRGVRKVVYDGRTAGCIEDAGVAAWLCALLPEARELRVTCPAGVPPVLSGAFAMPQLREVRLLVGTTVAAESQSVSYMRMFCGTVEFALAHVRPGQRVCVEDVTGRLSGDQLRSARDIVGRVQGGESVHIVGKG